jgi:hypothetical protein
MARKAFWAARPFGYGDIPMLDVGQVIEIEVGQQRNDEKLIRLGLLREVAHERPVQCGKCPAKFLDAGHLNRHGNNRHAVSAVESGRREAPDADLDTAAALGNLRALEAADDFAEKNIPLDLEKTKASRATGRRASR